MTTAAAAPAATAATVAAVESSAKAASAASPSAAVLHDESGGSALALSHSEHEIALETREGAREHAEADWGKREKY